MGSFSKLWGWAVLPPLLLLIGTGSAPVAQAAQASDRIGGQIDDGITVTLPRHVRPEVALASVMGSPERDLPMERMILTLKPDTAQQAAFEKANRV
jgi:hypothetical protein